MPPLHSLSLSHDVPCGSVAAAIAVFVSAMGSPPDSFAPSFRANTRTCPKPLSRITHTPPRRVCVCLVVPRPWSVWCNALLSPLRNVLVDHCCAVRCCQLPPVHICGWAHGVCMCVCVCAHTRFCFVCVSRKRATRSSICCHAAPAESIIPYHAPKLRTAHRSRDRCPLQCGEHICALGADAQG